MDEEKERKFINCIENGLITEEGNQILSELSSNEAKYLKEKYGSLLDNNSTLEDISKQLDVTRKRIKEIEEKALKRLRNNKPDGDGPDVA
jgi:RNA polymerase primary sigma factor